MGKHVDLSRDYTEPSWTIYGDWVGGVQLTTVTHDQSVAHKYRSFGYRVEKN